MKIKILNSFCLRPREDVNPGDVVEVAPYEAAFPISMGWAEPFDGEEDDRSAAAAQPSLAAGFRKGARK